MRTENEIFLSRTAEQAFLSIAAMVSGKKDVDPNFLVSTIQNYKQMYDFNEANIKRMEAEQKKADNQ